MGYDLGGTVNLGILPPTKPERWEARPELWAPCVSDSSLRNWELNLSQCQKDHFMPHLPAQLLQHKCPAHQGLWNTVHSHHAYNYRLGGTWAQTARAWCLLVLLFQTTKNKVTDVLCEVHQKDLGPSKGFQPWLSCRTLARLLEAYGKISLMKRSKSI